MDNVNQKKVIIADQLTDFVYKKKLFGGIVITGVIDPDVNEMIIPEGVTEIADNAFSGERCENLTNVTLSSTVKKIGNAAFKNLSSLVSLTLANVVEIGEYAFSLTSISDLILPETVVSIGKGAFANSTNLSEITLPVSLKSIGEDAFAGCNALVIRTKLASLPTKTHISVPVVYSCETNDVASDGNIYVTDSGIRYVISNGKCKTSFQKKDISSVLIPAYISYKDEEIKVNEVSEKSFYGCSALTDIVIEDGVEAIGSLAFGCCSSLSSARIEGKNINIGESIFYNCSLLSFLELDFTEGSNMNNKHIGYLFTGSDLPNFYTAKCADGDTEYPIPESLTELTVSGGRLDSNSISGCHSITELNIDGVTELCESFLLGCRSIKALSIPESVEIIEKNAFFGASVSELDVALIKDGYSEGAFAGCSELSDLSLSFGDGKAEKHLATLFGRDPYTLSYAVKAPDGEESNAFFFVPKRLKRITVYGSRIPTGAFENMTELQRVNIREAVEIGDYSFMRCTSLIEVVIPASVRHIESIAFAECYALADITLPDNLLTIGVQAFEHCESVRKVTLTSRLVEIGRNAFSNCKSLEYVKIMPGLINMPEGLFRSCHNLKSIELPNGIETIGEKAFLEATTLREIDLPETVVEIGEDAFLSCYSLSRVTMTDNVRKIGSGAFSGCYSLSEITLPKNISELNNYLFSFCNLLKSLTIPKNVSMIGSQVFSNTIKEIVLEEGNEHFVIKDGNLYTADGRELVWMCTPIERGVYRIADGTEVVRYNSLCSTISEIIIPNSVTKFCDSLTNTGITLRFYSKEAPDFDRDMSKATIVLDAENNDIATNGNIYTVIDGIRYIITENGAILTDHQNSLEKDCVIPESIVYKGKSYPVNATESKYTLSVCLQVFPHSLTLPEALITEEILRDLSGNILSRFQIKIPFEKENKSAISSRNAFEAYRKERLYADKYFVWDCNNNRLNESGTELGVVDEILYEFSEEKATALTNLSASYAFFDIPPSVNYNGKTYPVTNLGGRIQRSAWNSVEVLKIPASVVEKLTYSTIHQKHYDTHLSLIEVDKDNPVYSSVNGVLYDKYLTKLICCPACSYEEYLQIPEGVTEICANAIEENKFLKKVDLPSTLKVIGEAAFSNTENIEEIRVPEGATKIFEYAFSECHALKILYLPGTLTAIGSDSGSAFYKSEHIKKIFFSGTKEQWDNLMNNSKSAEDLVNAEIIVNYHE